MDRKRDIFYKQRPRKGPGDRQERARQKDVESKSNRANLLASKRRIPLSEIQEEETAKPTLKERRDRRMEQLKEWQKKREEAKKKEQEKKKKPFVAGTKRVPFQPQISLPKSNSGDPLVQKSTSTENLKSTIAQKPKSVSPPSAKPSTSKAARPPRQTSNTKPSKDVKSLKQPKAQRHTPPVTRSSSRLSSRQPTNKPASKLSSSGSKRAAAKTTKPAPSSARNQTTRGSASKKGQKLTPKAARKNLSTKKASEQRKEEMSTATTEENKEQINASPTNSPTALVQTKPSSPTSTHKYARPNYVAPSPCYVSVRPNSQVREVSFPHMYVNDPAWIPGAVIKSLTPKSSAAVPNFDEAFGNFSPFQFTAGIKSCTPTNNFAFTFRKHVGKTPQSLLKESLKPSSLNISTDSLGAASSATENAVPVSPKVCLGDSVSNSIRRSLSNLSMSGSRIVQEKRKSLVIEIVNPGVEVEEEEMGKPSKMEPLVLDLGEDSSENLATSGKTPNKESTSPSPPSDASTDPSPPQGDSGSLDVAYFRKIHSDVTTRLTELCQKWEEKSASLEEQEDISEDVLGQLRTTVCQAQLLMRQKLKQYLGLVEGAAKEQEGRTTSAEDLQGFWDMVYFQVEDVEKKFEHLSELEKNGWKERAQKPKGRKTKKRVAAKPSGEEGNSEDSERLQAAREKRQASRNRLREMKAAAKRAREASEGVVTELPSPKKTKEVSPGKSSQRRSMRKTPSKRRSSALINFNDPEDPSSSSHTTSSSLPVARSVFSPSASSSNPDTSLEHSTEDDPPTAQLLSLTPCKGVQKSSLTTSQTSSDSQGAFHRMFVSITPSKRIRELAGTDVIMSPARRSIRLADRGVKCSAEKLVLPSLLKVPDDVNFAYCPNNALL